MRLMGVLVVCTLLALCSAEPAAAWPDRRSEGLWEMTIWFRSTGNPEETIRRRERRCFATQATYPWDNVFDAVAGKSYGKRVTLDRDRMVVEKVRVWDRSRRYNFPWMSADWNGASMWITGSEHSGDPERHIEVQTQSYRRDVVAGTASKDVARAFEHAEDQRRLGDCPPEFQFMTLREIWRSIFQWGF